MRTSRRPEPHQDHAVQFYRDDPALMKTVSRFVRDGLTAGQPVIVIATSDHRRALGAQLLADGLLVDSFERHGSFWLLDARETLESFMDGRAPNPVKFRAVIGSLIKLARSRTNPALRAYGEMVDLLWKDGNPEAAIQLEMLWNQLAAEQQFMLLCGYCIGNFYKEAGPFDIGDVCGHHARVLPA